VDCLIPLDNSLEKAELVLDGRNKEMFLNFVRSKGDANVAAGGPQNSKRAA
jgi:hypothetical protein